MGDNAPNYCTTPICLILNNLQFSISYRFLILLSLFFAFSANTNINAQCVTNVDFNSWSQAGFTANGNWAVQNGGSQVHQTVNGNPTFYISPFKLICVRISGNFRTENNDDDFMGFVFSFLNPLGQSDNYDGWLFDWKQVTQASGGFTGQQGKALNRIKGIIPSSAYSQTFWGHTNTPEFTVAQNDFGGAGWVKDFDHHFELRLTYTHVTIFIDGDSVFDYDDCFLPGYFGFYNYSQADCYYKNFNFEPYINFKVLTPEICLNDTAKFQFVDICQDSSLYDFSSFQSMTWDFGDGNTQINNNIHVGNVNTSHRYSQPGTYNIILSVQDYQGCIGRDTQQVVVNALPLPSFSVQDVCFGLTSSFVNQTTVFNDSINNVTWNFDELSSGLSNTSTLQSPTHTYSACDTFNVKLIAVSGKGCTDSIVQPAIINCLPIVNFTNTPVCLNQPSAFTDSTNGSNLLWSWRFGDNSTSALQNPQHTYATCGTFNTQLIVTNNHQCKDSITKVVTVNCLPDVNFGVNKVCNGTPTVFSDSSTAASGSINSWSWKYGDNSVPGFLPNPQHLYTNPGNYSATLIAIDNLGCADTTTKPVTVYFNPVANFTVQDVCLNDSVFFTDSSFVDTSASVTTYLWVFSDGTPTSASKDPAHMYINPGEYNVTLLVTTNQLCSDAANKPVNVFDSPVASFTVNDVCVSDSAAFINSSINPSSGIIASWAWNFGDGTTNSTTLNPSHLYAASGNYLATLITYSSNLACADTLTDSITVFPMPTATFSSQQVCFGLPVTFTDASSVTGNNTIVTWNWDFDDESASSSQNPNHIYTAFGNYNTSLIVTTGNGCKDTVSNPAVVHPTPDATFINSNICYGEYAVFTDQSTIAPNSTNDAIFSWRWDFGDNTPFINNQNATYLYDTFGTYTVELKVESDFGCADSVSKTLVVNPKPVVNFTVNDTIGCEPLCVLFTDASTISSGANTLWNWDPGDGSNTGNSAILNHCYNNDSVFSPNQFSVTLTVTSDSGCVSALTKPNYITVYPKPVANFITSPTTLTIVDPVITFNNLSTGANLWSWTFGDSDSSAIQTPLAHTYADTGSYLIRLIAGNQFDCADTSYQTIIIEPDFVFYVPSAFTPNDDGINDTFTGEGVFINEFEMLIFDRWGNLIYQTDDITKPWDGKSNNGSELAQKDVYVYAITVTDFKKMKHKYRGTVTIVK